MNAAEYAAKRDAGICTWGSCRRAATDGVLCKPHRLAHRKLVCKRLRRIYWTKKEAGLCVARYCESQAREDSVFCQACTEKNSRDHKRYRSSEKGKTWYRKYQQKKRQDRIDRGLCIRCDRKLATKTVCEVHRQLVLAKYRERVGRGPNLKERCSLCKQPGHRSNRCTGLAPLPPLRIEDFATARTEVAA